MSTQMEQFFKVMLAFIMVMVLGAYVSNILEENFSSFEIIEDSANSNTECTDN